MTDRVLVIIDGILLVVGASLIAKDVIQWLVKDTEDLRATALRNQNVLSLRNKDITSNEEMVKHLQRALVYCLPVNTTKKAPTTDIGVVRHNEVAEAMLKIDR